MKHDFLNYEGINPVAREGFNPSNKNEVCQGAGKSKRLSWISHSPDSLIYNYCSSIFNSPI